LRGSILMVGPSHSQKKEDARRRYAGGKEAEELGYRQAGHAIIEK